MRDTLNLCALKCALLLLATGLCGSLSAASERQYVEKTGVYLQLIAEGENGETPSYLHNLQVGKTYYELVDFTADKSLASGDTLTVSGALEANRLAVGSYVRHDLDNPNTRSQLSGTRNVVLIYLNFSDKDILPHVINNVPPAMYFNQYTPIDLDGDNNVTASDAHVDASLQQSSYGLLSIERDANSDGQVDAYGPYTLSLDSSTCSLYQAWANSGDVFAELDGADLSLYQHRIYIVPSHACNWNGLAILGCGDNCRAWSRTAWQQTLSHELGHNFGLNHAGADTNGDGFILGDEQAADRGVMVASGSSTLSGHLMHAPHRHRLGWLQTASGELTEVTSTASVNLDDLQNGAGLNPKAVKLDVGSHPFFIAYRQGNLDEYGLVQSWFSPQADIADRVRVHECVDTQCSRTALRASLASNESYLYDNGTPGERFFISAGTTGADSTQVTIYYGDQDGDGVDDVVDNCLTFANPSQLDTDCDGFGNRCDGDFNNDGNVNSIDTGILSQHFFTDYELTDLNEDGLVNAVDLGLFQLLFFLPPGPAGPVNQCDS